MPAIQNQHQSAAPRAALLYQSGYKRIKRAPRNRTRRAAVDALHVRMPGPQAADVDANAASARHDLHHLRERIDDAPPRIFRRRHNVAIVESKFLIGAGGCKDTPGWHELPSVQ